MRELLANRLSELETVTEDDVANVTKKGVQTLRNDRHLGRGIPYVKLGRSVRYLLKDVEQYLRSHKIETQDSRNAN